MASKNPVHDYGFTPVPLSIPILLKGKSKEIHIPTPLKISSIEFPNTPVVLESLQYAKTELPIPTFNHCMRVFYFGLAIARDKFPEFYLSPETYLLSCLFHDIGTTTKNQHATLLSFEWYGGFLALQNLLSYGAPKEQAESVAEAVIRHQEISTATVDAGERITFVGAILQLATILDNMGFNAEIVCGETVEEVVGAWPREGWSRCFAKTIREENSLKPWGHTTALGVDAFPDSVMGNKLMEKFES